MVYALSIGFWIHDITNPFKYVTDKMEIFNVCSCVPTYQIPELAETLYISPLTELSSLKHSQCVPGKH